MICGKLLMIKKIDPTIVKGTVMIPACMIARIKRKFANLFKGGIKRVSKKVKTLVIVTPPTKGSPLLQSAFDTNKSCLFSTGSA